MIETSQPPAPTPPLASLPAGRGSGRPTSVIVLSIIGILIGAMFLLCAPLSIVGLVVDFGVPNPQLDAMRRDPLLMAWNWFGVGSMLIFGAWGLIGSIGSLIMRRWGRSAMVMYAIVETTLTTATAVATFAIVQPRMKAAMGTQTGAMPPEWMAYLQIGFTVALLAYFLSVWYFFTRPRVTEAFEAAEAGNV
jgi:hypothetical protein